MSDVTASQRCEPSLDTQLPGAMDAAAQSAGVFHRLFMIYGLWVVVALIYWPSSIGLNALWTNAPAETYTHGYLILLISLWLIYRDRKRLAAAPRQPAPLALVPLILLSAAWVWAWRSVLQEPHLMLLPLLLFTAIVAAYGWPLARRLAFPIGYLYFAMPVWSDINIYVQTLSAKVSALLIWITGLPAFVEGDYVHLPAGIIEIARSCSGLHEFIVGLALATLYGKVAGEPMRRRLLWIAVMGVLSLVVNWVRIFTVLVAAYFSDMHSSLVAHHYWLGWWLFAGVFALFLWWAGREPQANDPKQGTRPPRSALSTLGQRSAWTVMIATLATLAVLPALAYGMDWAHSSDNPTLAITWPAAPNGWSGPQRVTSGDWHPAFRQPSGESLARYTNASGESIETFTVAYRVQNQNAKLVSFWNHLLGGDTGLKRQSTHTVHTPSGAWQETLATDSTGQRSLIWSRYRVGNRLFVRPRLSQLWYGLRALVLRPPVSSLTALRAACVPDCAAARHNLRAQAERIHPTIH